MVSISDTGGTVATYQYDGRNRRVIKNTTSTSETRHFYYTNNRQDIEERVGTAMTMDKQYVWAAPSMVKRGIAYIDQLICRDDPTPQRLYACQDANFNLTAITDTSGNVVERYVFDPYGDRTIYDASWTVQSTSSYSWPIGHQGLMLDQECGLICNRERTLISPLGRFLQRDLPLLPGLDRESNGAAQLGVRTLQYRDGMNLYELERSAPVSRTDASGRYSALVICGCHGSFLGIPTVGAVAVDTICFGCLPAIAAAQLAAAKGPCCTPGTAFGLGPGAVLLGICIDRAVAASGTGCVCISVPLVGV